MRKIGILYALLFFWVTPLFAELQGEAYTGSHFIRIKPGARANSIGLAYTAFADDGSVVFWNPAGLITIPNTSFTAGAIVANYDSFYGHFSFVKKSSFLSWGIGGLGNTITKIKTYDNAGNSSSPLKNMQGYGVFDLSFFLTDFSTMGLGAKAGYQKIDQREFYTITSTTALMINVLYFQFTMVIHDLGYSLDQFNKQTQFLYPDFVFGFSYTKTNDQDEKSFGISLSVERNFDLPVSETKLGLGTFINIWTAEKKFEDIFEKSKTPSNFLALNVGIESYHGIYFSTGITLAVWGLKIDYATLFPKKYMKSNFSHHVSIEYRF